MAVREPTVPTCGLQMQQVGPEPTDLRPGGAVKTPWLLAIVLLSFVAVPALSWLDLASVALYHSRAVRRVH